MEKPDHVFENLAYGATDQRKDLITQVASPGGDPVKVRAASFMMPLPDGTRLYTAIAAPVGLAEDDRYPLVFVRSPYEPMKEPDLEQFCQSYNMFLPFGYAVVFQHCRGTGASEGEFFPYLNERSDGLAVLEKIRALPFYNKEIFLWGQSYLASVHFSYLSAAPEDIRGAILMVQSIYRPFRSRNGFLKVPSAEWGFLQYRRNDRIRRDYTRDVFRMLPLSGMTEAVFGEKVPLDKTLQDPEVDDHPEITPYYRDALKNFRFPILFIGGFYDIYAEDMFRMWHSLDEERRKKCAMIFTPYDHPWSCQYNPRRHCVAFEHGSVWEEWPDHYSCFFDYCRGRRPQPGFVTPGNITYYGLWEKKWYTVPRFDDGEKCFTLHLGERKLQPEPGTGRITFTYNPFAPAEFKGGCPFLMDGMKEQDQPDFRYDVVSFLSEHFSEPLKVRGKFQAKIHVASDCEDTAFYLRLSIVKGEHTYCLREDITSICRQHPAYRPGEEVPLAFHFVEHAFTVEPGDRLRLDISSSCWPIFLPHTNLKGNRYFHTTANVARNTIICDGSRLTLHITPA